MLVANRFGLANKTRPQLHAEIKKLQEHRSFQSVFRRDAQRNQPPEEECRPDFTGPGLLATDIAVGGDFALLCAGCCTVTDSICRQAASAVHTAWDRT